MRTGRPAIVSDPMAPKALSTTPVKLGQTCGAWVMISMLVATSSNGTGLEEVVAMLVWRTRRCAVPISWSMQRVSWRHLKHCATNYP